MVWPVALAIAGALCLAVGAAVQESAASSRPDVTGFRFLATLARDPMWLLGTVLMGIGVAAHLVALAYAPVTLIQPLGVTGLLVAVWAAARLHRRLLTRAEIAGAAAMTVGLAALVATLPRHDAPPTDPNLTELGFLAFALATVLTVAALTRHRLRRAIALAVAAGACFGVASALIRLIAFAARNDASSVVAWPTPVALALLVLGGALLQHSYRLGHFAVSYALLLIADPLVASLTAVSLFGEPLPVGGAAMGAAVAAAVIASGVALLVRSVPAPREPVDQVRGERPHSAVTDGTRRGPISVNPPATPTKQSI